MIKEQLIIILESTLLNFDGLDKIEIKKLNEDFDDSLIQIGINLNKFLEQKIK